jgi:hypothetical protein
MAAVAEVYVAEYSRLNAVSDLVTRMDKKRERSTAVLYAEKRLTEWAKWARDNRGNLGYPTISTLYKAMRERLEPGKGTWAVPKLKPNELPPLMTAMGKETRSMIPPTVGDAPETVMEVDSVVIKLPKDLHEVIVADYFTYGPIEVRAKKTRWKRARYSQLLECAKYSVYAALDSRMLSEDSI